MKPLQVFIGWDSREVAAYEVAEFSLRRRSSVPVEVHPLKLRELREREILTRPVDRKPSGGLWCPISMAPMSTEFAISRFAVPFLQTGGGWALFTDCDVLWRADVAELFALADPRYALMVVKHDQKVDPSRLKMDGQAQTAYARKNWSSVMLWNLDHPAHRQLTHVMLNGLPGRELHRFCWLRESEIGALPAAWNVLVEPEEPKLLHYTLGGPWFPATRKCAYSDEWTLERDVLEIARLETGVTHAP